MAEQSITVEVVYAAIDRQVLRSIQVPFGATIRQALVVSGMANNFPELDLADCPVGIFGKVVAGDKQLQEGDRIEIYRPLLADPKEIRRVRAAKAAKARLDKPR